MKKDLKAPAVAELAELFGRARIAILTESVGLPVNQVTELRKQLRGVKAEYRIMKNTLAIRASEGTGLAGLKAHLKGPTGMVIGFPTSGLAVVRFDSGLCNAEPGAGYLESFHAPGDM